MATDSRTHATGALADDASFRAWAKSFSDSLRAGGCTATADTGQINLTTVARPGTQNTFAGYEIYSLTTDSKLADLGLYFKIEYGLGSGNIGNIAMTVGTGTNGSGTINGTVGTRRTFPVGSSNSGGTTYTCGGDGRLILVGQWVAGNATANGGWVFIIERLRDNAGAVTGDGIYTFLAGPNGANISNSYTETIRSGSVSSGMVSGRFGATVQNATANFLSDFYMATHHPVDRNTFYNPILSNLFYYHTDLTAGTDITVSRYGTNRTYKPIGQLPTTASTAWQNQNFGHTNGGIAILWE